MDLLFVYGTLRSVFDNDHARLLRSQGEWAGEGVMPGSIFRIGDYPGYRQQPGGTVHGELYRLPKADETLAILDEYEGPEFERIQVEARWIYQFTKQPPESARILSGDFCRP